MYSNINITLKKLLFDSPSTVSGKLYREHRHMAFPNEEMFKEFLSEPDEQKKTQIAKDIILRLAFCSPFYIPNRYLFNLLHFEQMTKTTNQAGFTPQDHFVHSIYLYLLGIYIFFYHRNIHSAVLSHFKHYRMISEKSQTLHRRSTADSNAIYDFLYAWRLFALAHDVGYPWENDGSSKFDDFRKPFTDIKKAIEKECSLRILSKCITLMRLINKEREVHFAHEPGNLPQGDGYRFDIGSDKPDTYDLAQMNKMSDWCRLPQINGFMYARTIASVYSNDSIIAVLESQYLDEPILFLIPDNSSYCVITRLKSITKFGSVNNLCRSAFSTGEPPNLSYSWQYYVKNSEDGVKSFLVSALGPEGKSLFVELDKAITCQEVPPLTYLTTDHEFTEYAFLVYRSLLTSFQYDLSYSEEDKQDHLPEFMKKYNLANKVVHEQITHFADDIGESIKNKIREHVKIADVTDFSNKTLNEKIDFYFSFWASKADMVNDVRKDIAPILQKRIDQVFAKVSTYGLVRHTLRDKLIDIKPFDCVNNMIDHCVIDTLHVTSILLERFRDSYLKCVVKEDGNLSIVPFLKYRPDFAKTQGDKFVDHGVASACAMLGVQHLIQNAFDCIKANPIEPFSRLLCLGLNISPSCQCSASEHTVNTLSVESIAAMLIHNLFPENMATSEAKNYRTSLRVAPFSFLALLCDSLQPWDRMKLIDQGERDLLYKTTSGQFGIQIRGNEIFIVEGGKFLSIDERKDKLRNQLDSLLADASAFIRLNLREW